MKFGTSSFEGVYISLLLISPQIDISKVADEVFFTSETNKKVLKLIKESKGVLSREELSRLISQDEELKNIYEDLIFNADKIITEKVPLEDQLVLCENKLKKLFFEKKQNEIRTKIALAEEVEDAVNSEKLLVELLKINKILKELK